jgi:hypothetical protein
MIYVASPYSTPLAEPQATAVRNQRYRLAVKFVGFLVQQGLPAFSPIAYFHPYAEGLKLATDAAYWHEINMSFLRRAEVVFVLRLPGWDQSKGVQMETKLAKAACIPIVHWADKGDRYEQLSGPDIIEFEKPN